MINDKPIDDAQENNSSRLVFCLGSPGSGVGLLAGCLQLLGWSRSNERACSDAQIVNRLLLKDLGGSENGLPLPAGWLDSEPADRARQRIGTFLSAQDDVSGLYIADPELCRVLPLWIEACQQSAFKPFIVYIVRHPYEVALSLRKQNGRDLLQGHVLWLSYVRSAMKATSDIGTNLITFDQLLADPVSTMEFCLGSPLGPDRRRVSMQLLDFVQPSLKNNHAGSMPDHESEPFAPFTRLYDQLRRAQIESGFSSVAADWELVDTVLASEGHWKKKTAPAQTQKKASLQAEPLFSVAFSSANRDEDTVISHELIPGQWQKLTLTVPEPEILSQYPISIHLPSGQCTLQIASIQFEHEDNGRILWKASTPQDFDVLELNDHVHRVVDLNALTLVPVGDNPQAVIPSISNAQDLPTRLLLWLKVKNDQLIMNQARTQSKTNRTDDSKSNLVWLASYPRSGNTLLRTILRHNFDLKSYSVYNDLNDIGKFIEVSEVVGHQYMHWKSIVGQERPQDMSSENFQIFDPLRYKTQGLKPVKTHSSYHTGFAPDKTIYIYRDGRAALRSYASYKHAFTGIDQNLSDFFDELLCGCDNFTTPWSKHVFSWINCTQDNVLFLKFEDILSDFNATLKKIADFLGCSPLRTDILSFEYLNSINPDFFRKGKQKSWQDLFDDTRHALFWILNHQAMTALGYVADQHPICSPLQENSISEVEMPNSLRDLHYLDSLLTDCAQLIVDHTGKMPKTSRGSNAAQLKDAYARITSFLFQQGAVGRDSTWVHAWNNMFRELEKA